jgi:excisionase family DNA binding protein
MRRMKDDPTSPFLTLTEAADFLHVHRNTLRRWSDAGMISSYRLGVRGDRRFKREELAAFVEAMRR